MHFQLRASQFLDVLLFPFFFDSTLCSNRAQFPPWTVLDMSGWSDVFYVHLALEWRRSSWL